jgi:hypothetical protein
MNKNMIERLARTLTAREIYRFGDYHLSESEYVDKHWYQLVDSARAAVAEMRKPTDTMYDAVESCGLTWHENNATGVWQTMIDAILAEKNDE